MSASFRRLFNDILFLPDDCVSNLPVVNGLRIFCSLEVLSVGAEVVVNFQVLVGICSQMTRYMEKFEG